jgi:hypothetical protein
MWNIRKEAEEYILRLRADCENTEVVVAKTWKAGRCSLPSSASRREALPFCGHVCGISKETPPEPKTRVDLEAILDGIRV